MSKPKLVSRKKYKYKDKRKKKTRKQKYKYRGGSDAKQQESVEEQIDKE
jgi:hypothetical protein